MIVTNDESIANTDINESDVELNIGSNDKEVKLSDD